MAWTLERRMRSASLARAAATVGVVTEIACGVGVSEDPFPNVGSSGRGPNGVSADEGSVASPPDEGSTGGYADAASADDESVNDGSANDESIDEGVVDDGSQDDGSADDGSIDAENASDGSRSDASAPEAVSQDAGVSNEPSPEAVRLDDSGPGPRHVTCFDDVPFGASTRVPGLPPGAVRLRTGPDERVGYYALFSATSHYDIFVATRDTRSSAFGPGELLAFNDAAWDFSPALSGNGTILYLESNRDASWRIYQSEWDPETEAFGPIASTLGLSNVVGAHDDGGPYATPSEEAVYFHTNRQGRPLLAVARRSGASFGPVRLIDLGSLPIFGFPVVSPDELTLYFAVHAGTEAAGQHTDIWIATRTSTSRAFGNLREVNGVNTGANEVPSFISEDGCRLYFDRNTGSPFGWGRPDDGSYVAERRPPE